MKFRISFIFALLLAWSACKPALADSGALGMGAASLGAGGAAASRQDGCESMYWNPAGLAGLRDMETAWLSGLGGPANELQNSVCFGLPMDELGVLALSVDDLRPMTAASYRENSVSAGLAIPISSLVSLGLRQNFLNAAPGGLNGWSMDAGVQVALLPSSARLGELTLGLAAKDLVSSLAWQNGLQETRPVSLSGALGYSFNHSSWLGLQADYEDRPDLGGATQWRLGGEQAMFGRLLALRAGYTTNASTGSYYSLGAGSAFPVFGSLIHLDYAVLIPGGGSSSALQAVRHLAGLSLDFTQIQGEQAASPETPGKPRVKPTLRKDESGNEEASAQFDLAYLSKQKVKHWELKVVDSEGHTLRTFSGDGRPPKNLQWDGMSEVGQMASRKQGANYLLKVVDQEGVETNNSGEVLKAEKKEAPAPPPVRVKPSLRSKDNMELAGAEFDLGYLSKKPVKNWELKVVDAEGKTLKTFSGTGKPPKNLQWEGLTDIGSPVKSSKGAGYVLRTVEESGQEQASTGQLEEPAAFSQTLQTAREKACEPGEGGQVSCVYDKAGGQWCCTVYFPYAEYGLNERSLMDLENKVVALVRKVHPAEIQIHGHSDPASEKDFDFRLSQERANVVLAAFLEGCGPVSLPLVVTSYGGARPARPLSDVENRALNRRVEVFLLNNILPEGMMAQLSSVQPPSHAASKPTAVPTKAPAKQPKTQPTVSHPMEQPTAQPVEQPTAQPKEQPTAVTQSQPVEEATPVYQALPTPALEFKPLPILQE